MVPETQNPEASPDEFVIPPMVAGALGVLATIHFNDKVVFETGKIDDGAADRHLPADLPAVEPAIAQAISQTHLSVRGHRAHRPSKLSLALIDLPPHPPHPVCQPAWKTKLGQTGLSHKGRGDRGEAVPHLPSSPVGEGGLHWRGEAALRQSG